MFQTTVASIGTGLGTTTSTSEEEEVADVREMAENQAHTNESGPGPVVQAEVHVVEVPVAVHVAGVGEDDSGPREC